MAHYFLQKIASGLDAINAAIGNAAQWLTLIMVLVQFLVVILRYVFGIGSIQLQEAIIYMHGILFLSAAAATWQDDSHVRVDVFYVTASEKTKARINFLGTVFFAIPLTILILYVSFEYVSMSWAVRESSRETSGLPCLFVFKTFILIFAVQILAQGISILCRGGKLTPQT
jgi:TRAP-type mannitol/chloroaromatic compound transport system permease small subunit